jgi:two-component system chemotaxis sensor kinase CheA
MDVVRRNIDALRGTIDIASVDGEGATVTIRLPLTLAIIDGFAVGVADETYVVPLDAVQECLALPADRHEDGSGRGVVNLRGAPLPFVRMRQLMGAGGDAPARQHVLVVQDGAGRAGVVVDALHGESQAVIKSLGSTFRHLPCVSGSTILGSGRVALILDVPGLLRAARARTHTPTL